MSLGCGPCATATAATAASRAAAAPPAADADTVTVQHVALDLRFDWPQRQAHGSATLTLVPRVATRTARLDAGHLRIESVTLVGGRRLASTYEGGDRDGGLVLTLDRVYRPGERVVVRIAYRTGWVNQSDPANLGGSMGRGLRFFAPTTTDARKRQQIWSSGEPGSARYWFPTLDRPDVRHTTELRATVPVPLRAIASGTPAGVFAHADGTRTFHWRVTRPQASHRVALVVGEYESVRQRHEGIELDNFGYPDEREGVAASVPRLPDMVRYFSALTGARFPFPAYRQVFVQDFPWGHAGAMLGVVTENMVDDAGTHADFLYLWNGLQAETLAQQWFGLHLAPRDWSHLWLERAFAHHLAGLYSEHKNGREEFLLWYLRAGQQAYLGDWAGGARVPVVNPRHAATPGFLSGNDPYFRGAAVLHMLRTMLGDEAWRRVLRHYVREHGGQWVDTEDFRRAVEAVAGRPMQWFFDQWLHGVGHPVFEVSWRHDGERRAVELTVRQVQQPDPKVTAFAQPAYFQGPVDLDIDGRVFRVWLEAKAVNTFVLAAEHAPALVHFDHEGAWIKELRFTKPPEELLHQLRATSDAAGRQWAMDQLVALARAASTPAGLRQRIVGAFSELAAGRHYWRVRFNALQALRTVLAPGLSVTPTAIKVPAEPVALDETTRQVLLGIVRAEGGWLRAAALGLLGLTRDPGLAGLYLAHLRDPSDRVINAAATALGRSRSESAFDALQALPAHPSWKNQSLISALDGLRDLGDPRGVPLALQALADVRSARWTLATPVWDYRLAAAHTLAALGAGGQGAPVVLAHLEAALAENDVNDIFSNVLLLVALGDARGLDAIARVESRLGSDAEALAVLKGYRAQLEEKLKAR